MTPAWWLVFALAVLVGLAGDVCIKVAGAGAVRAGWLAAGMVTYAGAGLGWFWLLRRAKLSVFGTLYPLANAIGLLAIGFLVFREAVTARQWGGLAVGCVAFWLLAE